MKFLIKFPSRGRPEKFKSTLIRHIEYLSNNNKYKFIFSFDNDDLKMKNDEILDFLNSLNIDYEVFYGDNQNKIEAINANMENKEFDVLILVSDDMIPVLQNYDELICDIFNNAEYGLDSTIHFNTPMWANILDVWCIMGKPYYDRFGYIYYPGYKSIFADNEYTEISKSLGRKIFSDIVPFEHQYYSQIGDETEVKNWKFNNEDTETFNIRKEKKFDLDL